jgi:LPXTG-motif cell wall-anchored protein
MPAVSAPGAAAVPGVPKTAPANLPVFLILGLLALAAVALIVYFAMKR